MSYSELSSCFQDILLSSSFLCVLSTAASVEALKANLKYFKWTLSFQAAHSLVEKHSDSDVIKAFKKRKESASNNQAGLDDEDCDKEY